MEYGLDTIWECLRIKSMRCVCNLTNIQFGNSLEFFRRDEIGIWLGRNLEMSSIICDEMRLEFGYDLIWNCLRKISLRCDWSLAEEQFGIVLDFFGRDALGMWLRHNLELS